MKKVLSLLLAVVMIIGLLPVTALTASAAAAGETVTYTFSNFTAGTQYAKGEVHELDDTVSVTVNGGHFTTQLRVYKDTDAIISSKLPVTELTLNACYNKTGATLKIYTSTDGASFVEMTEQSFTSSYKDYTYTLPAGTMAVKLEAKNQQVRVAKATLTFGAASECAHTETMIGDDDKAPTCTEDGKTASTICAECDYVVTPGTLIPALGHNYVDGICATCGEADPLAGLTIVTEPQAATAYKLIIQQNNLGKVLYFAGTIDGTTTYRLATTEDVTASPDVYLDAVNGGYQLYFLDNGTKTYIRVSHMTDGDPGYGKGTLELTTTQPTEVYTFDTTANTLVYDYDGNNAYYFGTYNTYSTFGVSNTSYYTGSNAGNLDVTQFPSRLAIVAGSEGGETPEVCQHTNTTTTPGTAATCTTAGTTDSVVCNDCGVTITAATTIPATGHTYVDGVCACGDVAPVIPTIPTTGNYELVTDIAEITAGGKFVIVATYNGVNYAVGEEAVEVVLKDNKVAYLEGVTPTWTVASYNGGIALVKGDGYLGYKSGTDFSNAAANMPYTWNITAVEGEENAFYAIASSDDSRQIALYHSYGKLYTGAYSNSNLDKNYYDFGLNFYKLTEGDEMIFASSIVCLENGEINTIAEPAVGATFTLPEVGYVPEGYTFAGWTTTDITEEVAVAPATVLAAGTEIVVGNDATYYALYTRTEIVEGDTVYQLVTDVTSLTAGDVVIIATAADTEYALSTTQNGNNRSAVSAAKSGNTITYHDTVQLLTLEAGTQTNTFAFNTGAGYLYAASSSKNYLRTETTLSDNSSWLITVSADGVAAITAQGSNTRNQLKFNANNGNPIFSCYGSGQTDVALYKQSAGTSVTAYYVTYVEPPVPGSSQDNPADLTSDLLYEDDFSATVTIPAGATYYFLAYRVGGMFMSINGGEAVECVTSGMMMPYEWTITNDGTEAAEYVITVSYPVGNQANPATLVMGENTATIAEGSQGYHYTWTAEKDGNLTVTMPAGDWTYTINNMTTYVYGDKQWSDSDPVVNPATVTVKAGDTLEIVVNTYDPANPWTAPKGTLTFTAAFAEPEPEIVKFDIAVSRMILGNSLEFQFGVAKANFTDLTGVYAVVEKSWADGTTTEQIIPATEWIDADPYWAISYDTLAAKEMADVFNVTIYNAKGQAISNPKTDSVRDYVMRNVDNQKDNGKAIMVDMLNYGAAAQQRFGYGTSDLANNQLTETQQGWASQELAALTNGQVKGTNFLGTRLILESRIQLQMAFKNLTTDMYAIYTFTNNKGEVKNIRVEGTEFVDANGVLAIEMSELVYADARALVEVTVYNADGTVYGTATDSIEGYAARNNSNGDDVVALLMKFADSAKIYLYG